MEFQIQLLKRLLFVSKGRNLNFIKITTLISFLFLNNFNSIQAQKIIKSMQKLPDTGQIKSYTSTFGEDNDYKINEPVFIDNLDGTISDSISGLMWQKNDVGDISIENAIIFCDSLGLANYSDWRLPTALESMSILNLQNVNPALDTKYFTKSSAEYWWTSQTLAGDKSRVWVTNAGGGIGPHPKTESKSAGGSKNYHCRAVRNINPNIELQERFTINSDSTIKDNLTNLIWQKYPRLDSMTWENALLYSENLVYDNKNDWRLANIKELQSISDQTFANPVLDPIILKNLANKAFWSSTSQSNSPDKSWYLNTKTGITTYDSKLVKHYVVCVRQDSITSSINYNINGKSLDQQIIIYPNPFNSKINILADFEFESELYDVYSNLIYSGNKIHLQNFENLSDGIYFLKVPKSNQFIKLIKN